MFRLTRLSGRLTSVASLLVAVILIALSIPPIPIGAQQYSTTGSSPTSALPPNTWLARIPLAVDRPAIIVNNAMFGPSGNVYEFVDKSPVRLGVDHILFSGPNATPTEAADSSVLGTIAAGAVVYPIFVRGTRVFVYIEQTGDYAWIAPPESSIIETNPARPSAVNRPLAW